MAEKQAKIRTMKPTHSQQLRQLVAENTFLKQTIMLMEKEQRSVDYWKAIVNVVVIELQRIEKDTIKPDTPFSDFIQHVAENIVKELTEREKAKMAGETFNEEQKEAKQDDNE